MKLWLLIFLLFAGFLNSQDGLPGLIGNYNDINFIPPQIRQGHDFTFVRLIYNGRIIYNNKNWYTDYPEGDKTVLQVIKRLTNIDIAREIRAIGIHHPDLFNYPFVYSSEAGQMVFDESDALRMRDYLNRGGFWMIDDFWGTLEWNYFKKEIKKVFPEKEIIDIPIEHPIFHTLFDLESLIQVPNIGYIYCTLCPTWEQDGYEPKVSGIFDDEGRLMVVIYFNTDTMDAAEWADDPYYPHKFSAYAYKIFINTIIYAMTH